MKTTTLIGFLMASLLMTGAMACKKSSSSATGSGTTCKIIGVTDNYNGAIANYNIRYDSIGEITGVTAKGAVNFFRSISYGSNIIYVTSSDTLGFINELDTLTLDTNGRITSIHQYYPATRSHSDMIMAYITGTKLGYTTFTNNIGANTTSYGWTNGDMTQANSAGAVVNYAYNNMGVQDGDGLKIKMLLHYGTSYIKNAHLVSSVKVNANATTNHSYTLNNNGNIAIATATDGSITETLTYQYQCY